MGRIAENVELSQYALGIRTFREFFDTPGFLTFRDLPYVPRPEPPLLDKAILIVNQMRAKAEQAYNEGFAERTQSGTPAWIGPPGSPETRPIVISPEDAVGQVLNSAT